MTNFSLSSIISGGVVMLSAAILSQVTCSYFEITNIYACLLILVGYVAALFGVTFLVVYLIYRFL